MNEKQAVEMADVERDCYDIKIAIAQARLVKRLGERY